MNLDDAKELFIGGRISGDPEIEKRARAGLSKYGVTNYHKTSDYLRRAITYYQENVESMKSRKFINDSKVARTFGTEFYGTIYIPLQ